MPDISLTRRVSCAALVTLLISIASSTLAQTPPPTAGSNKPLEGTYWKASELAKKPVPTQDPKREAHLQFAKGRVAGSDGCNRVAGGYQLKGDRVTFLQMAATQMACLKPSGTEEPFHAALKNATRLTITGDRLELFDAAGTQLAAFLAGRPPSDSTPSSPLAGTSWQLVKFQSMVSRRSRRHCVLSLVPTRSSSAPRTESPGGTSRTMAASWKGCVSSESIQAASLPSQSSRDGWSDRSPTLQPTSPSRA